MTFSPKFIKVSIQLISTAKSGFLIKFFNVLDSCLHRNDNKSMNVTELARRVKITTAELLDVLPSLGFDIGRRAIKIDERTANKIINNWPQYRRQIEDMKKQAEKKDDQEEEILEKKTIKIPNSIVVRDFSNLAGLSISKVLGELMKNGIFVSMNEKIDFDTAAIIGEDLNLEVILDEKENKDGAESENKLKDILAKQKKGSLQERPPVIVVMGHVDHGKTKLLDAIRKTNVVDKEAGGITQHIGAYQVERNNKLITFIDTPGHEVFTAMRSRGAKAADVAILVVAADDGVKPQTVEAYRIIEQSELPFIVAINKIDKPGADVERVKNELSSQLKIVPEDWGGKTMCVPVSAKEGQGIEDVLDAILLLAEMDAEKIVANPDAAGVGTVIESHVDKGEGPVATILIQNGTLRSGDVMCLDNKPLGKTRIMRNYKGDIIKEATPSTPIRIAGLKSAPNIGDIIEVYSNEFNGDGQVNKKLRLNKIKKNIHQTNLVSSDGIDDDKIKKINVIIKSDVLGSAEAIEESLEKLNTKEIKVKVIKKGLGAVTENDIDRAISSNAIVAGFNVDVPNQLQLLAREKKVDIQTYNIIYELVDYVKSKMEVELGEEIVRKDLGKLKILAIFKTENNNQVIGGKVEEGKIELNAKAEVLRDESIMATGEISNLQAGKQDVKIVESGQECGAQFKGKPVIQIGDVLQLFTEEKVIKKL